MLFKKTHHLFVFSIPEPFAVGVWSGLGWAVQSARSSTSLAGGEGKGREPHGASVLRGSLALPTFWQCFHAQADVSHFSRVLDSKYNQSSPPVSPGRGCGGFSQGAVCGMWQEPGAGGTGARGGQ